MKLNTIISYLFYWEEPHVFGHIKAYKTTRFKSAGKKCKSITFNWQKTYLYGTNLVPLIIIWKLMAKIAKTIVYVISNLTFSIDIKIEIYFL